MIMQLGKTSWLLGTAPDWTAWWQVNAVTYGLFCLEQYPRVQLPTQIV